MTHIRVMHVVHDAHTAMLLGAMRVLAEQRDNLAGVIYFCFEEGRRGWQRNIGYVKSAQRPWCGRLLGNPCVCRA